MGVANREVYWDSIYGTTASTEVSWYQHDPATSLRLIQNVAPAAKATAVIDAGAGASLLVDSLLAEGFTNVTVLDVSYHALSEVRDRLGPGERHVTFVHHDVLTWNPDRQYDLWHDRAVFHFLTEPKDRTRYVELAASGVRTGGHLIVATFAEDGPTQCSGLPVHRYSADAIHDVFSRSFSLVAHEHEEHVTPKGVVQSFVWTTLNRVEAEE